MRRVGNSEIEMILGESVFLLKLADDFLQRGVDRYAGFLPAEEVFVFLSPAV